MILAGVDLAWHSEKNLSAIAYGKPNNGCISLSTIDPVVYGINRVIEKLKSEISLSGVAIDAPLIIRSSEGQRPCEKLISKVFGHGDTHFYEFPNDIAFHRDHAFNY